MIYGAGVYGGSVYGGGEAITAPNPPLPPAIISILNYYAALLIIQYRTKSKAVRTIKLLANQSVSDGFVFDERGCFDIDSAVGAQLDILGRIVGVPKVIHTFELGDTYFNFTRYDDTPVIVAGFGLYNDAPYNPNGYLFYHYSLYDKVTVTLSDVDMRTLIRMKIALNNSYFSFKFIKDFVYTFLNPDVTVVDNEDMSLTFSILTTFGDLARAALYLNMLPVPMGVKPNFVFV